MIAVLNNRSDAKRSAKEANRAAKEETGLCGLGALNVQYEDDGIRCSIVSITV